MEVLGDSFDIHGGGMDLKFPHHENEIAQSKCTTGKDLASYWMHTGPLRINQDKMSKSLDNFITIKDALKNYPSEVVRLFLISSHYRSPMNYSIDGLVESQASLDRLYTALKGCELTFDTEENKFSVQYREIMEDDFNVPGALAVFFDMAKSINLYKESNKTDQANKLARSLISLAEPLGILQQDPELYLKAGVLLSEDEIDALIKERELARTNKDFKRSDQIRDELVNMNIVLEDSVEGTSWRRK
jgi:cysteinyl-tRNA synthetase